MITKQKFGGNWTIEKLEILSSYFDYYLTALKNQPFKRIYIDAFAGTGTIKVESDEEAIEGSAKLALLAEAKFDKYIFIEQNRKFVLVLKEMIANQFSELSDRIEIYNEDCNLKLQELCKYIDWSKNRAVLFLDPYATEVKWETLEIIAATKAIDVWYLFPMSAATRLLKRDGAIDPSWRAKLDMIFGDCGWYDDFYKKDPQMNFFGDDDRYYKDVNTQMLRKYICNRLSTIFADVAPNPRILYNRKNSPLFLFCFAIANDSPKAIGLALKGANYILEYRNK